VTGGQFDAGCGAGAGAIFVSRKRHPLKERVKTSVSSSSKNFDGSAVCRYSLM